MTTPSCSDCPKPAHPKGPAATPTVSTASSGASENRVHRRRPYTGRVICAGSKGADFGPLDVSLTGIGMLSSRPFALGQRVTLHFLDADQLVTGVVTGVRAAFASDRHVGVAFDSPQPDLLARIHTDF